MKTTTSSGVHLGESNNQHDFFINFGDVDSNPINTVAVYSEFDIFGASTNGLSESLDSTAPNFRAGSMQGGVQGWGKSRAGGQILAPCSQS